MQSRLDFNFAIRPGTVRLIRRAHDKAWAASEVAPRSRAREAGGDRRGLGRLRLHASLGSARFPASVGTEGGPWRRRGCDDDKLR